MEHAENCTRESDHILIRETDNDLERIINIPSHQESFRDQRKCCQMHKVLPQLRLKKDQVRHVYDPEIVSLGPYHHGKSGLQKAEKFKVFCVNWLALGSVEKKKIFYDKIMENIDTIRSSYAENSILDQYNNEELARMMLQDGCFIINYMANETKMESNNLPDWQSQFGLAAFPFMLRDVMKLENQVPFLVVKLLISLKQGDEWEELIPNFLIWLLLVDGSEERVRIPREHESPPLHLLEAVWRAITQQNKEEHAKKKVSQSGQLGSRSWQKLPKLSIKKRKESDNALYHSQHMFRSVMDLKAKGIYFSPSSSYSLKAVRFKSFSYYGQLQLPVHYVSDQHQIMLSNFIAYELSPNTNTDHTVLAYTVLMKSLIESPEDVKELQKRGILFNQYSNHKQVVKSFKDIDTFDQVHFDVFGEVREKIGEHCRNIAKTWIADLIHTRCQSPWKIVGMFAATLIVFLTIVQTFYAVHQ